MVAVVAGGTVWRPVGEGSDGSVDELPRPWMNAPRSRLYPFCPLPMGELSTVSVATLHGRSGDCPQSCPQMWVKEGHVYRHSVLLPVRAAVGCGVAGHSHPPRPSRRWRRSVTITTTRRAERPTSMSRTCRYRSRTVGYFRSSVRPPTVSGPVRCARLPVTIRTRPRRGAERFGPRSVRLGVFRCVR